MSSTIGATTATQAGLNTLIVDSCGTSTGNYTVNYVLANCTSGSRCGAERPSSQRSPLVGC
jgi:hypothetical protein